MRTPPNANSIVFDDSLFVEFTEAIYMHYSEIELHYQAIYNPLIT